MCQVDDDVAAGLREVGNLGFSLGGFCNLLNRCELCCISVDPCRKTWVFRMQLFYQLLVPMWQIRGQCRKKAGVSDPRDRNVRPCFSLPAICICPVPAPA